MRPNMHAIRISTTTVALLLLAAFFGIGGGRTTIAASTTLKPIIYVNASATGANDGTSWQNGYRSLEDALAHAPTGSQVWVAEGTYAPTTPISPTDSTGRTATFRIPSGVVLYGGFAGTERLLEQRDWRTHPVTLTGQIGGAAKEDNVHHVVTLIDANEHTILDGFTIEGGYTDEWGGGILIRGGQPIIRNGFVEGNTAAMGGGIAIRQSKAVISHLTVRANTATDSGGGVAVEGGMAVLSNMLISGNVAQHGAGLSTTNAAPIAAHMTFSGNRAEETGGAIQSTQSNLSLINSIVWGNAPTQEQIADGGRDAPTIAFSIIEGLTSEENHNIAKDPLFVNPIDPQAAPSQQGSYVVGAQSPAVNAGSISRVLQDLSDVDGDNNRAERVEVDVAGNTRHVHSTVDIGAYELPYASLPTQVIRKTYINKTTRIITDDLSSGIRSPMTVDDSDQLLDLNVTLTISHTYVGDLQVELIAPSGTTIGLIDNRGRSSDHFIDTILDDQAPNPKIIYGDAPFSKSYRPEEPLSTLVGQSIRGEWTLRVKDRSKGDEGELLSWGMEMWVERGENYEPDPNDPALCHATAIPLIDTISTTVRIDDVRLITPPNDEEGCSIAGLMYVSVNGSEAQNITVRARVDAENRVHTTAISPFQLPLAGLTMQMEEVTFTDEQLRGDATLIVPEEWGGAQRPSPEQAVIGGEGLGFLKPDNENASIADFEAPKVRLPKIEAGKFSLEMAGMIYNLPTGGHKIEAEGGFTIPNLKRGDDCGIEVGAMLLSTEDGGSTMHIETLPAPETPITPARINALRLLECSLGYECDGIGIPVGTTGFLLTGIEGTISLEPGSEAIEVSVEVESAAQLKVSSMIGLEGGARIVFQPRFAFELEAALSVLGFDVSNASISISETDGFRTTVEIHAVVFRASTSIHAWQAEDDFHVTGSARGELGLQRGEVAEECVDLGFKEICVTIPPKNVTLGDVGADFGKFTNGQYGFKGEINVLDLITTGFFVGSDKKLVLGDVDTYQLVDSVDVARARWATRRGISLAEPRLRDISFANASEKDTPVDSVFIAADIMPSMAGGAQQNGPQDLMQPSDAITQVNVMMRTDTIFAVTADGELDISLVDPNGITITPDNYTDPYVPYHVSYEVITDTDGLSMTYQTQYGVDQAISGTWKLRLTGNTTTTNYVVSVMGMKHPPELRGMWVDPSDLANTTFTWSLLSEQRPTTVTLHLNTMPITETISYTSTNSYTSTGSITNSTRITKTIPIFSGIEVAWAVITDTDVLQGARMSVSADLSRLETNTYYAWMRIDDGVSSPIEGYITATDPYTIGTSGTSGAKATHIRVADREYDPLGLMAGVVPIHIDQTATLTQTWQTPITATIHQQTATDEGGLEIIWLPNMHPDVDSYELYVGTKPRQGVEGIPLGDVATTQSGQSGQPDTTPQPVTTWWHDIEAGQTYYLSFGAVDEDRGHTARTPEFGITVPFGTLSLGLPTTLYETQAGAVLSSTLVVTPSDNLYHSYADVLIDQDLLPDGIVVGEPQEVARNTYTAVLTLSKALQHGRYVVPFTARSGVVQTDAGLDVAVQPAAEEIQWLYLPIVER